MLRKSVYLLVIPLKKLLSTIHLKLSTVHGFASVSLCLSYRKPYEKELSNANS